MKSKLRLEPIDISPTAWYYEENGGIKVVAELRDENGYFGIVQTKIPWRKLYKSVENKKNS